VKEKQCHEPDEKNEVRSPIWGQGGEKKESKSVEFGEQVKQRDSRKGAGVDLNRTRGERFRREK